MNEKYFIFPDSKQQEALSSPSPSPELSEVGGKALSLIKTSELHFPVPPGFVLTVSFFQPWLEQIKQTKAWKSFISRLPTNSDPESNVTKEDCDAIKEQCKKILKLTADQRSYIQDALKATFGHDTDGDLGIVAVRSSSPEEDLAGSSFAGGYDTSLGVTSAGLQDAIVDSFASLFDHRIYLYKIQHGMAADTPRIAIIVQRQISSDVSGVGFSLNPNNNCFDEIVISSNFGLGESVVSGIITPDTYVVDSFDPSKMEVISKKVAEKSSAIWLDEVSGGTHQESNKSPTAQALTDNQILEVARMVSDVEDKYFDGSPADIEWAFHDNTLYLLQARPVTAYVPLFPEMITERGTEKRLYLDVMVMTQGFSDPLSTLGLDMWKTFLAMMKPTMSTEGFDGLMFNIHGREYMNISNMLMMTGGSAMVNSALRTYDKSLDRAFDSIDLKDYTPSYVPSGTKGIFGKSIKQLLTTIPNILRGLYYGKDSMKQYVEDTNAMLEHCHIHRYPDDKPMVEVYDELTKTYEEVVPQVGGIVSGLISKALLHRMFRNCEGSEDNLINLSMDLNGNPTSEMGHFMVQLASRREIQETETSEQFLKKLSEGSFSDEFTSLYSDYLKRFGCRGTREIDVATPRMYEKQDELFDALKQIDAEKNQIINVRERRDKAYQELLSMAREMGKEKTFVHHASVMQGVLGYREHPKYMLVVVTDACRRHALQVAKDFVKKGRLENAEQIFSLTMDQISRAQKDDEIDLLPLVRANLKPVEEVSHVKNWPILIDSRGKIIRGKREITEVKEGLLIGDPISPGPGIVRGRAKVLMDPYEKPLETGEILVARFTEPSWTPLFISAGGVLMEIGGPMQHGAIIAREYGIPCVSGIDNATKLVKDGDLLELDGSAGTVQIISDDAL
mmetsp:Transcript_23724/g.37216  ORF Transcript_23724/g.37216 Transcript_23724/m.37216 type:complete len:902 (-) Transcript_23724:202-2907(-)